MVSYPPGPDLRTFPGIADLLPDAPADDPRVFIGIEGSAAMLAAVMRLLAPPFVEHRGAVLLGFSFDPATVDDWFDRLGDVAAVEGIVNHVHLWDLLPPHTLSEGEAERLAAPLAWFWGAALRAAHPDREFVVEVTQDGGYGPEVTFYGR